MKDITHTAPDIDYPGSAVKSIQKKVPVMSLEESIVRNEISKAHELKKKNMGMPADGSS